MTSIAQIIALDPERVIAPDRPGSEYRILRGAIEAFSLDHAVPAMQATWERVHDGNNIDEPGEIKSGI